MRTKVVARLLAVITHELPAFLLISAGGVHAFPPCVPFFPSIPGAPADVPLGPETSGCGFEKWGFSFSTAVGGRTAVPLAGPEVSPGCSARSAGAPKTTPTAMKPQPKIRSLFMPRSPPAKGLVTTLGNYVAEGTGPARLRIEECPPGWLLHRPRQQCVMRLRADASACSFFAESAERSADGRSIARRLLLITRARQAFDKASPRRRGL